MSTGDISKWRKKAGDPIKVGESIAEIVTGVYPPLCIPNLVKIKRVWTLNLKKRVLWLKY